MLTIFGLVLLASIVVYLIYLGNDKEKVAAIIGTCICSIAGAVFLGVTWGQSYTNYIEMKQRYVNFQNHAKTINSYTELALHFENSASLEITDLKYQNYQTSVKELISDFRNSCIRYNQLLIGKRTMGNNIVFNWLIVMPDEDMKTVKVSDFLGMEAG